MLKCGLRLLKRNHLCLKRNHLCLSTNGIPPTYWRPQSSPIQFCRRLSQTTWWPPGSAQAELPSRQYSTSLGSGASTGPSSSRWSSTPINILLSVVGFLGLGYLYALGDINCSVLPQAYCQEEPEQNPPSSHKNFNFIADVVEKASPSVVQITVAKRLVSFHHGEVLATNSGSGFVVEDGNYVLTNAHVVHAAQPIVEVELYSGQVVKGTVTDIDEIVDLAVIKLDLPKGTSVPPLRFSESSGLRTGEWVVAIGSPLSLTNTITCGIISCLHRSSEQLGLSKDMEYIQTDAAITHGNSGGPLVNLDGEVVGVNTMTATAGISFAIPCTIAQNFVRSANKSATGMLRYTVGIGIINLNPGILEVMRYSGLIPNDVASGVLVSRVSPNSPADRAGMKIRDIVVNINGQQVNSVQDIKKMVGSGKRLTIGYYRKHQYMTCTVDPCQI